MASLVKHIQVAVGVIIKNDLFFVCRRQAHQHQGNKWEFPGGKLDQGESAEDALKRELAEEVGISITTSEHLMEIEHNYPDKKVSLHVYIVSDFAGEPYGAEGQESAWFHFNSLKNLDFPEANQNIIEKLAQVRN